MKVSCGRSELRDALRIVAGVVDPRNLKPVLQDVHLRTCDGRLEISGTDLEVGIKYWVSDVEIKEEGGIVIPADIVSGIIGELKEERVTLRSEKNGLMVEATGRRFHVVGLSEEEFPEIPDFPEENALEIEGAILREMIEKTIFAVAVEKQRYALNGVLLAVKERSPRMEMVGTDGRRLALIRRKANGSSPVTASAIIPVKALQQLQKMIQEEETVKLNLQERQVLLKTEKGVIVAQLVEGRFPAYKEVIPEDSDKKLEVAAADMANAIRQAAVLTARESRAICLRIEGSTMTVESSSVDAGDAHVELGVKYEGSPVEIRFNPDYLLDGIKAVEDENIRLDMKDATRAVVMRSGVDYLYVVMPITQD